MLGALRFGFGFVRALADEFFRLLDPSKYLTSNSPSLLSVLCVSVFTLFLSALSPPDDFVPSQLSAAWTAEQFARLAGCFPADAAEFPDRPVFSARALGDPLSRVLFHRVAPAARQQPFGEALNST